MSRAVLEYVAQNLVDRPDDVRISEVSDDGETVLELRVHPEDMGKIIGKRGRTAKAIRAIVKAASTSDGSPSTVEIVE